MTTTITLHDLYLDPAGPGRAVKRIKATCGDETRCLVTLAAGHHHIVYRAEIDVPSNADEMEATFMRLFAKAQYLMGEDADTFIIEHIDKKGQPMREPEHDAPHSP